MPSSYTPTLFYKDGVIEIANSPSEYWQYVYDGWTKGGAVAGPGGTNSIQPTPNWTMVEVRGTLLGWDGAPMVGQIRFRPRASRNKDLTALVEIIRTEFIAAIQPDGTFSILLPATDDPSLSIVGFTYEVIEDFLGGANLPPFDVEVSQAAAEDGIEYVLLATEGTLSEGTPSYVTEVLQARADAVAAAATATTKAGEASTSAATATTGAGTATAQAAIATTKAGEASTSAATATAQAAIATTKAGEASTSAATATAQAAIATTKASEADVSADAALASELAAEAAAGGAAAQAALLAAVPQAIATSQGYWVVVQDAPPVATTMYGVPILWIDRTTALIPVPVNPPSPTYNDATSQFTIPSGVIGVDYVWTSGGGGVPGTMLAQGGTVSTSGAFPRTVVITPVAKPGYVKATPAQTFTHDFPDPALITVMTSDGFSGPAVTDFAGRVADLVAGGSAVTYSGAGGLTLLDRAAIDGSGSLIPVTGVGTRAPGLYVAAQNLRIEWDLTSINLNGASNTATAFGIEMWKATSPTAWTKSIGFNFGAQRMRASAANLVGGSVDITWDSGGAFPVIGTATPLGHYTLQWYGKSLTLIVPDGLGGFVTRTAWLDPSIYAAAAAPYYTQNSVAAVTAYGTVQLGSIDNLKISKVGF